MPHGTSHRASPRLYFRAAYNYPTIQLLDRAASGDCLLFLAVRPALAVEAEPVLEARDDPRAPPLGAGPAGGWSLLRPLHHGDEAMRQPMRRPPSAKSSGEGSRAWDR